MRRVFWISVGAALGIYAVYRLQQLSSSLTPAAVGEQVTGLWSEVKTAAAERETELRKALGLEPS